MKGWWLAAHRSTDPAQRFAAEMAFGFGAFQLLATGAFCLTELAWGSARLGLLYAIAWVPILLILLWLRRGGAPQRANFALMTVLFALVTLTNLTTGGRAIGANIALPTVVLFGVLMSSPRAGAVWSALAIGEILGVAWLRNRPFHFPIEPDPRWVRSAIDRVPLFFSLASVLIALLIRRALDYFQASMEAAREQAAAAADRFAGFAELAADGFWETDAQLRLTFVSPGFAQALGLSVEQMLGLTPEQAYRHRFPQVGALDKYMQPLQEGAAFRDQRLHFLDASGGRRLLLNEGVPVRNEDGAFLGYRGVVRDITEQYRAEEALRANEQRLRSMSESVPAIIAYLDSEERYRFCNHLVGQVLGREDDQILGRTMREVRGAAIYEPLAGHIARALRGETVTFEGEGEFEGRHRYFQTSYIPDQHDGRVQGFYSITFDITDVKQSQLELADVSRRLKLITDNLPALISYIDAGKVFRFNNSAYEQWLGRPLAEITGRPVSELYDADTYRLVEPHLLRALHGETVTFELEPAGTRHRHVRVNYVPQIANDGRVLGVFGLIQDVSELKQVELQLRELAENDALTGLPNRTRFAARLSEAIARSERERDCLAVLYLDIDRFKTINDTLGHAAGDLVLQEFARRLRACVRQTDSVTRLAGDEFVIVLEGTKEPHAVTVVAGKILDAMKSPFDIEGQPHAISTSIGVVVRRHGELDGAELLSRADQALYAAKSAGRGRFHVASD